jgi:hypothetical protein
MYAGRKRQTRGNPAPSSAFSAGHGLLAVTAAFPKFERPAINLKAVGGSSLYFLLLVPLVPLVKGQSTCSQAGARVSGFQSLIVCSRRRLPITSWLVRHLPSSALYSSLAWASAISCSHLSPYVVSVCDAANVVQRSLSLGCQANLLRAAAICAFPLSP